MISDVSLSGKSRSKFRREKSGLKKVIWCVFLWPCVLVCVTFFDKQSRELCDDIGMGFEHVFEDIRI